MKQKLVYISSEWMYDVEMGILHHISEQYEIHWFFLNNELAPRVSRQEVEAFVQRHSIKLYWMNNNIKQLSPRKIFYCLKMAKVINAIHPDMIIHVEQDFYWSLVNKFFMKKKAIYMIHDVLVHSGTHNGWVRQFFTDFTIRMNKHFITFSNSQKNILLDRYGKNKDVFSTHLSVKDFGRPTAIRPAYGDVAKLLFFGRIEYNKGLDILIDGLENLYGKGCKNIELSICGKGSYWKECEKRIKHPGHYDLQIRYIDNAEIPNLFASHHFLVLPYRDTTQSGPLMIAANYGLPLLASNQDSFKEIYDGDCSILYDHIEEGLMKIASLTSEEYENMLLKCTELREKFSGKVIASEIMNYISQIS